MKFITPVAMKVTKEQFETDIEKPIKELKYKVFEIHNWDVMPVIATNLADNHDECSNTYEIHKDKYNRYVIKSYNPELFLALAAMTEGSIPIVGEYMTWIYDEPHTKWNLQYGDLQRVNDMQALGIKEQGYFGPQYSRNHWRKSTKEEIIAHFTKQKTMEKQLIGYNVKPEFKEVAGKVANITVFGTMDKTCDFKVNSCTFDKLNKAKVLDLWCEKVYKEEKKVFSLHSEGSTFELTVSKQGIYYNPDDQFLDDGDLLNIIAPKSFRSNHKYIFTQVVTHVNLGCKTNVPVKDVEEVLKYYNSIK